MDAFGVATTSFQLIHILLQLRTYLKHQPRKFMSWDEELSCLNKTIASVRDNPKLHTKLVKTILERVVAKAKALKNLLQQLSPVHQKNKFDIQKNIQKITNALTAKSNESRILNYFADLERDKTTLLLAISTINSPDLDKPEDNPKSNTKAQKPRKNMAQNKSQHLLTDHILEKIFQPKPIRVRQHQFMNNRQHVQHLHLTATSIASNPNSTGAIDPRGNSDITVRNVISGNKAEGNRSSLAISHRMGGIIEGNEFKGDGRLDGIHEEEVMKTYVTEVQTCPMELDEKEEVVAETHPPRGTPSDIVDPMEVDEEGKY